MTNKQILKKAIEKAYKKEGKYWIEGFLNNHIESDGDLRGDNYYSIIFSHEFAKAFWKNYEGWEQEEAQDEEWWSCDTEGYYLCPDFIGDRWQYHLQQLVLEKEPLLYIEKFLK